MVGLMSPAAALAFTVVGVATVTGWLFKIIDAIEAPQKRRNKA